MVLLKFTLIKIAELVKLFKQCRGRVIDLLFSKIQETTPSYHLQLQGQLFSCLRLESHLSIWMPANLSNTEKKNALKIKRPQVFIEHFMSEWGQMEKRVYKISAQRYQKVGSVIILQMKKLRLSISDCQVHGAREGIGLHDPGPSDPRCFRQDVFSLPPTFFLLNSQILLWYYTFPSSLVISGPAAPPQPHSL